MTVESKKVVNYTGKPEIGLSPELIVIGAGAVASLENGNMGETIDHNPWEEIDVEAHMPVVVDATDSEVVARGLRISGLLHRTIEQIEPEEADGIHDLIGEARRFAQSGVIRGLTEEDFDRADERVLARAA